MLISIRCALYSPMTFLAFHIEVMYKIDGITDVGNSRALPRTPPLMMPEIFDGRSLCLLEYCYYEKQGPPDKVLFVGESGVTSEIGRGWACEYNAEVKEADVPKVDVPRPKQEDRMGKKRRMVDRSEEFAEYYWISSNDNDELPALWCVFIGRVF